MSDGGSFIAYAVQRYPALRTTFIRREVEALRKLGMTIQVFSMRPAAVHELRDDPEAQAHLASTHALPANPISLGSVRANVSWAIRSPRVVAQNIRLALANPGVSARWKRLRLMLQVWRAAPMASAIRRIGHCSHLHAQFADGAATTALACARLLGVRFSFTSHTSHDSPALREKLAEAKFIASISEYDRQRLIELGDTSMSDRIHVIHCGIPLDQWPFEPKAAIGRPIRIVSVGALVETKGHDVLIRACAALNERGIDLRCKIIGGGGLNDHLQRLVRELKLGEIVELTGPQSQQYVRAALRSADLFVLACRRASNGDTEGVPVVLMEAMAMGRLAVSTRISGIPELINDRDNGYLAEPGDAESLAKAIAAAISRCGQIPALLASARAQVERRYSSCGEAARLIQLLAPGTAMAASETQASQCAPPPDAQLGGSGSLLEAAVDELD